MPRIGHTKAAVATANTNRDGSGTVELIHTVENVQGEYIDNIAVRSLGTNVATVAAVIGTNGAGLANPRNNWLMGTASLESSTLGTYAATDNVTIAIGAWLDPGTEIYALVHHAQAAGRQFVAYSDPTYQVY